MIYDLDCVHLNFSDLRNLFLGANQISEIPSEIKAFKRLKVLYLGGNSLTQLPAEICELQRLQALILAQNELKSLPNSICNLKKLETLQLHQVMLVTFSRVRPRFYDQVGHQTTNASIGNEYFFTK